MELRIAKAISYIFHPLFIPFYTILVLLNSDSFLSLMIPLKGKLLLAGIVLFTTVLLPLFTSLLLIRMKIIHSIFPKTRAERIYLLLNVAIFYYLTYYLLKGTHVSIVFNYFMLGSTFLVICSLMVTFFFRISLHMIATGGLLGGLIGLTFLHSVDLTGSILVMILLAGVIGSARLLIIDSQKPAEVYYGFLMGITVMFLLFILI
jgi:hypothetical protein